VFSTRDAVAVVMTCFIIYLIWVYYFSTFLENAMYNVRHAYGWVKSFYSVSHNQAYSHFPLHVSLVLILQAANSLMLFANIYYAINDILDELTNGSGQTIGNLLLTLYGQSNSTEVVIPIGNQTLTLNSTQISNATYLNTTIGQLGDQQSAYFVFDILEKVFDSYSIPIPPSYGNLLTQLLDGQVPNDTETYVNLIAILEYRFIYSTICYLVSCVIGIV
jgi:hypothetical protein